MARARANVTPTPNQMRIRKLAAQRRREAENPTPPEEIEQRRRAAAIAIAGIRAGTPIAPPSKVYLIICSSYVKIGAASQPAWRLKEMMVGNPFEMTLALVMDGGVKAERELHRRFKKHHHRREWFRLSEEIMDFILDNGGTLP